MKQPSAAEWITLLWMEGYQQPGEKFPELLMKAWVFYLAGGDVWKCVWNTLKKRIYSHKKENMLRNWTYTHQQVKMTFRETKTIDVFFLIFKMI